MYGGVASAPRPPYAMGQCVSRNAGWDPDVRALQHDAQVAVGPAWVVHGASVSGMGRVMFDAARAHANTRPATVASTAPQRGRHATMRHATRTDASEGSNGASNGDRGAGEALWGVKATPIVKDARRGGMAREEEVAILALLDATVKSGHSSVHDGPAPAGPLSVPGLPRHPVGVRWHGARNGYAFLVVERFQCSLLEYLEIHAPPQQPVPQLVVRRCAARLVRALHAFHTATGCLHFDIGLSSIGVRAHTFGGRARASTGRVDTGLDLALAHVAQRIPLRDDDGTPRAWPPILVPPRPGCASLAAHCGLPLHFADDLEALGYVLLAMAMGGLPWAGLCRDVHRFDTAAVVAAKQEAVAQLRSCEELRWLSDYFAVVLAARASGVAVPYDTLLRVCSGGSHAGHRTRAPPERHVPPPHQKRTLRRDSPSLPPRRARSVSAMSAPTLRALAATTPPPPRSRRRNSATTSFSNRRLAHVSTAGGPSTPARTPSVPRSRQPRTKPPPPPPVRSASRARMRGSGHRLGRHKSMPALPTRPRRGSVPTLARNARTSGGERRSRPRTGLRPPALD